ncbi:MAG: hypothetical protein JW839_09460 [Candidatus Lokiarchaeota archaeon]|nr:hypothetical protein [Candidatus Lokiarchaeota archaeon]
MLRRFGISKRPAGSKVRETGAGGGWLGTMAADGLRLVPVLARGTRYLAVFR